MSNQAVFLDRDGTLIEHYDYLTDASQVQLLPRTASALRLLKDHGYLLVLVTNQSVVARGMLTEETLFEIHNRLKELLGEQGVYLDQIYYCPFHPEGVVEKYRRESEMRKPSPGMLKLAAKEMDIDLGQSWTVGDDDRDIQAGERAGCKTIQIDSHTTSSFVHRGEAKPDYRAVNLQEAANLILRFSDRREHRELPAHRFYGPESEGEEAKKISESIGEPQEARIHDSEETPAVVRETEVVVKESLQEISSPELQPKQVSVKTGLRKKPAQANIRKTKPRVVAEEPVKSEPEHRFATSVESNREEPALASKAMASKRISLEESRDLTKDEREERDKNAVAAEPDDSEPDEREDFAKAVRDTEIARRKEQKKRIEESIQLRDSLEEGPGEEIDEGVEGTRRLLAQILRELKALNRQQHFTEFSVSKLLAGVTQMLVILCLILSFWFVSRAEPKPASAQACLLVALVLQTLTLTLLTMHKA